MPWVLEGMKTDFSQLQLQSSDLNPQHPDGVGEGGSASCLSPLMPPPFRPKTGVFTFAGIPLAVPLGHRTFSAEQLSAFKRDALQEESFLTPG